MKLLTLLLLSLSIILGCAENPNGTLANTSFRNTASFVSDTLAGPVTLAVSSPHYSFPYQLNEPTKSFKMPDKLEEISGLCISPDNKFLYTIQDEKGNIYKIETKTGEVTDKIDFRKNGDYEGIAYYQNKLYITKSNGTIYQVEDFADEDDLKVESYKTDLKEKNDVEGLCYQPSSNSLLIACKGIPTMGETVEESDRRKSVYRFDLNTNKLIDQPLYKITLQDVQKFLKEANHGDFKKFQSYLDEDNHFKFNPSGIAIHPKTQEIYILSSSKKMLMILNPAGKIQHLAKLSKKLHRQPEGITFGQDGTLYIANEGKGGHGMVYVYQPE